MFNAKEINEKMLPKSNDIINGILYLKSQIYLTRFKHCDLIKEMSNIIDNIWNKSSIDHKSKKLIYYKIKFIYNQYRVCKKFVKNDKINNIYEKFDKLFDIAINENILCKEDKLFLKDQREARRMMIGNITWSDGGYLT